jgi:uncharacterized protein (TIGR03437 family)
MPILATPYMDTSYSGAVRVEMSQPGGGYKAALFSSTQPYGLMIPADGLTAILAGGTKAYLATPTGPANVGRASQPMALADFNGDGSPGVAYVSTNPSQVTVGFGTSQAVFSSSKSYTIGPNVSGVIAADFNGDGKADLAVSYSGDGTNPGGVAILLSNGNGAFAAPVTYVAGASPVSVAALDLNHDGRLDLAVADNGSSPGRVWVLLGRGDGTFGTAQNYPAGPHPLSVTIADFNGDGKPDLAVTAGDNSLSILLGNGDGTFHAAASYATGANPMYVAAGDFNKDGKMDLAVANTSAQTVSIFLGKGDGTFQAGYSYVTSYQPQSLAITDYDGDGNLDILQGSGDARMIGPGIQSGTTDLLLGNGDGTFQGAISVAVGGSQGSVASFLAVGDFNGDGKIDAVLNDQYGGNLYLFAGDGKGGFQAPQTINALASGGAAAGPSGAAAGDFNGDGKLDLAVTESFTGKVAVLLNSTSGLQLSGTFSSGGSTPGLVVAADFNGDGKLDLAVANAANLSPFQPGNLTVFFGDGHGGFQLSHTYTAGTWPLGLAVADLNRDGKPDLVVTDYGGDPSASPRTPGAVYVFLNDGHGGFQTPSQLAVGSAYPYSVWIGDVNGDGKPDLVVASENANVTYSLAVLLGNGDGTFQAPTTVSTQYHPSGVAFGDFNGDGIVDLMVSHCCGATDMTFMQGNGDGTFQPEVHFNSAANSFAVAAADLNGDGKPDLIVGGSNPPSITPMLYNAAPAPSPAATVNWATGGTQVAPNSIASVYGTHLANATALSGSPATTLAGTTVTVTDSAGLAQPALLYYASPTQLNIVMPGGMASGTANVSVKSGDGVVSGGTVNVAAAAPGILTVSGGLLNAYAVHYDAQGNQVGLAQTVQLGGSGNLVATPISLDPPTGSVYLLVYGTGIRGAPQSQVTVQVGSVKIAPAYSGAQSQYPGLDQINILLPYSLKGAGSVTLTVTAAGQASNNALLTIQ